MNLFISHSWDNKLQADKIATALIDAGFTVWMDDTHLLEGEKIQAKIDEQLAKTDIVILIWSQNAAESKGVAPEIETAKQLDKQVIICKLDNTRFEKYPHLAELKSVDFSDIEDGIGRLKIVLINYMDNDATILDEETRQMLNEFKSSLQVINQLVHKKGLREKDDEEKQYWIDKLLVRLNRAKASLSEEYLILEEVKEFVSPRMELIGKNLNNKQVFEKVLLDLYRHKHASHPSMKQFILQIEEMAGSFETTDFENKTAPAGFLKPASKYKKDITDNLSQSNDLIRKSVGGLLPDFLIAPIIERVAYFYSTSAQVLQNLTLLFEANPNDEELQDYLLFVCNYLKEPNNSIDSEKWGIWGYTDEAWLIFIVTAVLTEKGKIPATFLQIDWTAIEEAGEVIFGLLGAEFKNQIEKYCQEFFASKMPQQHIDYERIERIKQGRKDIWNAALLSIEGDLGF